VPGKEGVKRVYTSAVPEVDLPHLARLARLDLSTDEAARLEADCRRVLDMAASVQKLDTASVLPLVHAIEYVPPLRPDELKPSLPREEAVKGAPAFQDGFFLVPKIKD